MKKSINLNLIVSLSISLSLLYGVVRYNIFNDVPWTDLPLYVLNKAVALSSVLLFSIFKILKRSEENKQIKLLKDYSVILALLHVIISLVILSPNYYKKFYSDSQLNLIGNLTLLFGIIAFIIMFLFSTKYFFRKSVSDKNIMMKIQYVFLISLILHVSFMGFNGWFEPKTWPGGLPPITLLAFIILLVPLFKKFRLSDTN